jgi:hypothetical protein
VVRRLLELLLVLLLLLLLVLLRDANGAARR